ncbi:MAG TPA: hypothetical protein VM597_07150, partial [Gemmataceae bacterium]|nr:hypothetical protein [Gemmataceae bacterium]
LIGSGLSTDRCDDMLVAFSWCLAQHDRDPERFGIHLLLWEFRWVVSSLPTFPEVSLEKIEEMKAEMARRYQMFGASPRSFALMCRKMAVDMGDREAADRMNDWLRRCPQDVLSDGAETERGFELTYRLFRGEYARTIKVATPFLDRTIRSDHFEGQACADVLFPFLRARRPAEAMPYHRRGYRLRAASVRHLDSIGKHLAFLALTDNTTKALRLLEKHLPEALAATNSFTRLKFLLEIPVIFDRLAAGGSDSVKVRLPPTVPLNRVKDRYSVGELRDWLSGLAAELATAFDRRNGNSYYTTRLADLPKLQRWARPCPLSG